MQEYTENITQRMENIYNGLGDEFQALYDINDFDNKIKELKKAGCDSSRPNILQKLFCMFDACGIEYEKGKDNKYYEELVKKSDIPSDNEIEDKIIYALYLEYEKYPSPKDYILRIVDRLCDKNDGWEGDTLRVRILKQFIKYGNYLKGKCGGYGGHKYICEYFEKATGKKQSDKKILELLSDDIFDVLEEAQKKDLKPEGKYGLLKAADDLAGGKFRTQGATKKLLYLFAIVYGMTYYTGSEDEVINYETDIEKNLFCDYYTNNLMRFISEEYRGNLTSYELNPSGQGINYKNFAEVIYLYYIVSDYSPIEKLKRATAMIEKIKATQTDNSAAVPVPYDKVTGYLKGKYKREQNIPIDDFESILKSSENEFEQFIIKNYNCKTCIKATEGYYIGEMQLETEQQTAFNNYTNILRKIEELGKALENCNYGLWFTDVAAFRKKGYKNICDRNPDVNGEKFEEFMELLMAVNDFLGRTVEEEESHKNENEECKKLSVSKTKALFITDPKEITRTYIIVAFYYYYNAEHEGEEWKSFSEVWESFKAEVDEFLISSFYQPLNGKNIFDILVVFSSYAYLNN